MYLLLLLTWFLVHWQPVVQILLLLPVGLNSGLPLVANLINVS